MQNVYNKYGLEQCDCECVVTFDHIESRDLLSHEKYFIEYYSADLNIQKDPLDYQDCSYINKEVFQFDQFGQLITSYKSVSEAARTLNVDPSNIVVCCNNPKRQRVCKGYL